MGARRLSGSSIATASPGTAAAASSTIPTAGSRTRATSSRRSVASSTCRSRLCASSTPSRTPWTQNPLETPRLRTDRKQRRQKRSCLNKTRRNISSMRDMSFGTTSNSGRARIPTKAAIDSEGKRPPVVPATWQPGPDRSNRFSPNSNIYRATPRNGSPKRPGAA